MTNMYTFAGVPSVDLPRSKFKQPSRHCTTIDGGYLYPIYWQAVLPGDSFDMRGVVHGRMATNIVPVLDNIYCDMHWWYVPTRLLWDDWKKFNGERKNPNDSIDIPTPKISSGASGFDYNSLFDYLGLPVKVPNKRVNSFVPRMYNFIYNECYRDQNLIDSVPFKTDSTDDPISNYKLLKRGKRKDYFTSCLPQPQKGPDVILPVGESAPIVSDGNPLRFGRGSSTSNLSNLYTHSNGSNPYMEFSNTTSNGQAVYFGNIGLSADLSNSKGITVNDLREFIQTQKFLEIDMRSGSRYNEVIKGHFGVDVPDYRVQRPEFLGGGTSELNSYVVPQTSATVNGQTPQGNISAYSEFAVSTNFVKSFTEHGYIMCLISLRTDYTYQNGIEKEWTKTTRYDFYHPVFANLGEQPVLKQELFADGSEKDEEVFGYQEYAADYRYKNSYVTGRLRNSHPQSLKYWTYSQELTSDSAVLNQDFIEENPPFARSAAVQNDEPLFVVDSYFYNLPTRVMPMYSIPGRLDHFGGV